MIVGVKIEPSLIRIWQEINSVNHLKSYKKNTVFIGKRIVNDV